MIFSSISYINCNQKMRIKFVLTAFVVNFGLNFVQSHNQMKDKLKSLFDSVAENNMQDGNMYRETMKQEIAREQRAFVVMKEELRIARNRNSYERRKKYTDESIIATKREAIRNTNNRGTDDSNIIRGPGFKSPTFERELEETTLDEYLLAVAERRSNDISLIDATSDEKLTSKEYLEKSYNLAAQLQALGCGKNVVVGIMSENRLEYPIVVLGTILTGATLTCFNPAYTVDELELVYNIAKPTILFCSAENYDNLKRVVPSSSIIILFDSIKTSDELPPELRFSRLTQSSNARRTAVKNRPDDVVFILYSSGTTGLPKGVMLTHKNMVYIMKIVVDEQLIETRGSTAVTIVPMFHCYGLHNLLAASARNQTLVIMPRYDEGLYLSTIQKYRIKHLSLVPTLVTFLLNDERVGEDDLSSVEAITCGGASLKNETERAIKKKFGLQYIQQGYGLTECTLINTIKNLQNVKPGTCGSVIPGAEMKVVDTRTGSVLRKNEIGEICVRGPHIMKGYYGNTSDTFETFDKEGWLHSGDVGYFDDDGDLFIVDRAKDLIKYKSYQVAPAELEALLLTHPDITDCGVIGIPDEVAGELPRAYVVKRNGAAVTEEEIINYIKGKVSPQKRLSGGVEFVSEIPKNRSGKILRRKLKELWTTRNESKL